jgi:hypothetical protein
MYPAESAVPSPPPADPGHEVVPTTPQHPTAMSRHKKTDAERRADAEEMERFKYDIDLAAYAWAHGWRPRNWGSKGAPDPLQPGRYRRFGEKDKQLLQVYRDRSGKYMWCDPANPAVGGSIIDFCRWESPHGKGMGSLGEVRKELRRELGLVGKPRIEQDAQPAPQVVAQPVSADLHTPARERVNAEFDAALVVANSGYLAARGLRPETLGDRRFHGSFRVRRYSGEVLFPHDDGHFKEAGVCGFERKGPRGTRFADGGIRALWHSNTFIGDKTLVVTESAIDGLSFHQLFPASNARYMATGGTQKSTQGELIARALRRLPPDGRFVIATDNDFHHLKDFLEEHAGLRQVLHVGAEANTQVQVFTHKTGEAVAIQTEPSGKAFACKALTPQLLAGLVDRAQDPGYRVRFDQLAGESAPILSLADYLAAKKIELDPELKMPRNPGRVMAQQLRIIAQETRPDLQVEAPLPPFGFKDWNDVVQDTEREFIRHAAAANEKKTERDRSR